MPYATASNHKQSFNSNSGSKQYNIQINTRDCTPQISCIQKLFPETQTHKNSIGLNQQRIHDNKLTKTLVTKELKSYEKNKIDIYVPKSTQHKNSEFDKNRVEFKLLY